MRKPNEPKPLHARGTRSTSTLQMLAPRAGQRAQYTDAPTDIVTTQGKEGSCSTGGRGEDDRGGEAGRARFCTSAPFSAPHFLTRVNFFLDTIYDSRTSHSMA